MKLITIIDITIAIAIIAGIREGIDEAAFQAFFALCVVGGICVAFFAWGKWYHNRHNPEQESDEIVEIRRKIAAREIGQNYALN
jgi:hypothetical protein